MSAIPVLPLAESPEGYHETLTERLGRGRLPLAKALGYATEIAAGLRDLHMQGLVYGAVSSHLVVLSEHGARLRNRGSLARLGDSRGDVAGFGLLLNEMVRRVDGPEGLCAQLNSLAVLCRDGSAGMQRVVVTLRLLALKARHGKAPGRKPVLVAPRTRGRGLVRIRFSLHWKPLVNLVSLALSGN